MKRGPYKNTKYTRIYGMKTAEIIDFLGFTNEITIRDLHQTGLLGGLIDQKKRAICNTSTLKN